MSVLDIINKVRGVETDPETVARKEREESLEHQEAQRKLAEASEKSEAETGTTEDLTTLAREQLASEADPEKQSQREGERDMNGGGSSTQSQLDGLKAEATAKVKAAAEEAVEKGEEKLGFKKRIEKLAQSGGVLAPVFAWVLLKFHNTINWIGNFLGIDMDSESPSSKEGGTDSISAESSSVESLTDEVIPEGVKASDVFDETVGELEEAGVFTREDVDEMNEKVKSKREFLDFLAAKKIFTWVADGSVYLIDASKQRVCSLGTSMFSSWVGSIQNTWLVDHDTDYETGARMVNYMEEVGKYGLILGASEATIAMARKYLLGGSGGIRLLKVIKESWFWPGYIPIRALKTGKAVLGAIDSTGKFILNTKLNLRSMGETIKGNRELSTKIKEGAPDRIKAFRENIKSNHEWAEKMSQEMREDMENLAKLKDKNSSEYKVLEKKVKQNTDRVNESLQKISDEYNEMRRDFEKVGLHQELDDLKKHSRLVKKYIKAVDSSLVTRVIKSATGRGLIAVPIELGISLWGHYEGLMSDPTAELKEIVDELGVDILESAIEIMAPFGIYSWATLWTGKRAFSDDEVDSFGERAMAVVWGSYGLVGDVVGVITGGTGSAAARALRIGLKGSGKAGKVINIMPRLMNVVKELGGWNNLIDAIKLIKNGEKISQSSKALSVFKVGSQKIGGILKTLVYKEPSIGTTGVQLAF